MLVGFTCALAASFGGLVVGVTALTSAVSGHVPATCRRRLYCFPRHHPSPGNRFRFGTDQFVMLAITIPLLPNCARVVRSTALSIREIPYIGAARACGYSHTRIVMLHMAPNVVAPFLIMLTLSWVRPFWLRLR